MSIKKINKINEKQDNHKMTEVKLYLDITIMTGINRKQRDEKNWKQIFMEVGFEHYKIFPMFGFSLLLNSILEEYNKSLSSFTYVVLNKYVNESL